MPTQPQPPVCSATPFPCMLTPNRGEAVQAHRGLPRLLVPCRAGVSDPLLALAAGASAAGEKGKPKKVSAAVRAMQEAQEARARAEEDARQAEEERRQKVCGVLFCILVTHCAALTVQAAHVQNHTLLCSRAMNLPPGVLHGGPAQHAALLWRFRRRRRSGGRRRRRRPRRSGRRSGRSAAQRSAPRSAAAQMCPDARSKHCAAPCASTQSLNDILPCMKPVANRVRRAF
jgi:hypothetical protein